ncbi:MAG: hypothetical protein Q7L19_03295 [Pseudohongiella sp.]|nr:hypothetical protein [Pseudohongiella sp.]
MYKPVFRHCLPAFVGLIIAQAGFADAQESSQDQAPVVFDSGSFDSSAFDSLFDNAFDDSSLFGNSSNSARHFRFRLSHQISGHINRHKTQTPDGSVLQRTRGLENNRLGLNVRYQNPFASGWLLQGSAQIRAWLPGDYEYSAPGQYGNPERDDAEWRINELFVQRSGSQHSFSFGRQTIVWGETVGNSVLDVINTTEYRDLSIIDIEDARLNQWLLIWDMFGDQGNWSSFVNLYPEFDPVPVTGSPLFPRAAHVNGQPLRLGYHHRNKALFEAGTRWNRSFAGSDIAVMAARLYENPLRYTLPQLGTEELYGQLNAVSNINDYNLLGISANRAIGRLLLTLDVSWSQGILSDSINNLELPGGGSVPVPGFEKRNRLGMSAGMEYGISPTQQISLSVAAQRDQGTDLDARGNVLMRYSNNLRNDELVLSATMQSQLDGEALLLFLAADYRLSDDWEISSQLVLTKADAQTPLYFLDQDVRAGVTVTWNF